MDGSTSASSERASVGRSMARRARPKISRSRSSSRGPHRSRGVRPNRRSRPLRTDEQVRRAGRRVRTGWDVERDDGIQEVGLVGDADRDGRIEARHATKSDAGGSREGRDRAVERGLGVADVRAETDVGADPVNGHGHPPALAVTTARLALMRPVAVRILHPDPGPAAGPIEHWVAAARAGIAERHRAGFAATGAEDVRIVTGPPDDTPFGRRLGELVRADRPAGLVILGSGAIPLATAARSPRVRRGRGLR